MIISADHKATLLRFHEIAEHTRDSSQDFIAAADIGGPTEEMLAAATELAVLLELAVDEIYREIRRADDARNTKEHRSK